MRFTNHVTHTSCGYEVFTEAFDTRRTRTIIRHGIDRVCTVTTRGNRVHKQHERMVRFAEYAEARQGGFDVDPMVLHEVAVGRGAF